MQHIQQSFNELQTHDLYKIMQLRANIFMLGGKRLYKDLDDKDLHSTHLFYKDINHNIVAYTRVIPKEFSDLDAVSLGRVCVNLNYRNQQFGKKIVNNAIDYIKSNNNTNNIIITTRENVVKFYHKFGFQELADYYYDDDGIKRIKMELKL